MDVDDDPSVHRLEASAPVTGGLVVKKKDSSSTFKVPKPSLLGLDRLAAEKRKELENQKRLISFKDSEYDDDVSATPKSNTASQQTPDISNLHKLNRQYRETKDETPSHTGGVSDKARNRLAERSDKDKRGVYVSSKDSKKSRQDSDDEYYDRSRRLRRDKAYGKVRDRERDRDRDRRRDRDRNSSRSDRRRPSDSERSLHTPRFKDEPKTPYTAATASSSWDDEDEEKSARRSSWDFPTPKDGDSKRSEWSTRSSTSSIYRMKNKRNVEDDTPRPTPAHKFNAWANDRKRSGATPQTGGNFLKIYF